MRRDPGLRDPRDADEIRDAELAVAQESAEPDPALVTEEVEGFDAAGEVHNLGIAMYGCTVLRPADPVKRAAPAPVSGLTEDLVRSSPTSWLSRATR